jgi:hypothetical protein
MFTIAGAQPGWPTEDGRGRFDVTALTGLAGVHRVPSRNGRCGNHTSQQINRSKCEIPEMHPHKKELGESLIGVDRRLPGWDSGQFHKDASMLPLPAGREARSGVGTLPYLRQRPERTLLYQLIDVRQVDLR